MRKLLLLIGSIVEIATNITFYFGIDYTKINGKTIIPFSLFSAIMIFGMITFIVFFFENEEVTK